MFWFLSLVCPLQGCNWETPSSIQIIHLTDSWRVLGCVLGAFWCHTSQTRYFKAFVLGSRTIKCPSFKDRILKSYSISAAYCCVYLDREMLWYLGARESYNCGLIPTAELLPGGHLHNNDLQTLHSVTYNTSVLVMWLMCFPSLCIMKSAAWTWQWVIFSWWQFLLMEENNNKVCMGKSTCKVLVSECLLCRLN